MRGSRRISAWSGAGGTWYRRGIGSRLTDIFNCTSCVVCSFNTTPGRLIADFGAILAFNDRNEFYAGDCELLQRHHLLFGKDSNPLDEDRCSESTSFLISEFGNLGARRDY